jgi:hypothetical protein
VQIGVLLEVVGVTGVALFASQGTGWAIIAPFLFVYGIGIGLATAQLTGVIMIDVPMEKTGQGSGSQSTVRQVGSALGIAVLGTLLFSGTQVSIENRLKDYDLSQEQISVLSSTVVDSAGAAIPQLSVKLQSQGIPAQVGDEIQVAAGDAFTDGAKWAAWAAAGFLVLGLGSTVNLGRKNSKAESK